MNAHLEIILAHCYMLVSTGANHLFFGVFSVDKSKSQLSLFCLHGCFLPTRKLTVLDHSRYEKLLTNIRYTVQWSKWPKFVSLHYWLTTYWILKNDVLMLILLLLYYWTLKYVSGKIHASQIQLVNLDGHFKWGHLQKPNSDWIWRFPSIVSRP